MRTQTKLGLIAGAIALATLVGCGRNQNTQIAQGTKIAQGTIDTCEVNGETLVIARNPTDQYLVEQANITENAPTLLNRNASRMLFRKYLPEIIQNLSMVDEYVKSGEGWTAGVRDWDRIINNEGDRFHTLTLNLSSKAVIGQDTVSYDIRINDVKENGKGIDAVYISPDRWASFFLMNSVGKAMQSNRGSDTTIVSLIYGFNEFPEFFNAVNRVYQSAPMSINRDRIGILTYQSPTGEVITMTASNEGIAHQIGRQIEQECLRQNFETAKSVLTRVAKKDTSITSE